MKLAVKSVAVLAVSIGAVAGMTACSKSSSPEDLPTPSISIPTSAPTGGSGDAGGITAGKGLPAGWPSDVPTPTGLELQGGGSTGTAMSAAWSGTADATAVQNDLKTKFKDAGWTSTTSFGGGATGSVMLWTKGTQKVQVTVAQQNGKTAVSETVILKS